MTRNESKTAASRPNTESTRTLRELGVPGVLAADLEAAFRALGATEGGKVIGFTFVTPDGERHALRAPAAPAYGRAA